AHRKFRFDARFRAILGGTRRSIEKAIENGFPSLPTGCVIQLDRESERAILENVRAALGTGRRGLIEDLVELARESGGGDSVTLARFLVEAGFELADIYDEGSASGAWTWTRLRREAGLEARPARPSDAAFERAFARMLHIDD